MFVQVKALGRWQRIRSAQINLNDNSYIKKGEQFENNAYRKMLGAAPLVQIVLPWV